MGRAETLYRQHQEENGKHNIILQNRCGNRLTLLFHEEQVEMELLYKPNAFRRKDFVARTFSNRDIQTPLFASATLPEVPVSDVKGFEYDPFLTKVNIALENGGKNQYQFINVIDENCFAISAIGPLTLAFRPHVAFHVEDGLITEQFTDRQEEIVSFILFPGAQENRFRVLADGTHILQICENDVIYFGGEENAYQVNRVAKKLRKLGLDKAGLAALVQYNETEIRAFTEISKLTIHNPDFQTVYDINKRINFSEFDEGGVTFGALNRLYHISWIRDTLMSSSMMALSGTPSMLALTYPFVFENPSVKKAVDGEEFREYLQMIGSRWGKSEDDGIFYVLYGLFNLYQSTGDDTYLWDKNLKYIVKAVDFAIETLFEPDVGLFGSDTLGETTLPSSPFFGYDSVNGSKNEYRCPHETRNGKNVSKCYALYHNVNMYNVLKMLVLLIQASPDATTEKVDSYNQLAQLLETNIATTLIDSQGIYRAGILILEDGEKLVIDDFRNLDLWEYVWAITVGPFLPNLDASLKSCNFVKEAWPTVDGYGLCPWNTMSRLMREYNLGDQAYEEMLKLEIRDALTYTEKYPMVGASTEYVGRSLDLRGLVFIFGSLMMSLHSLILYTTPSGLGVRASQLVDKVENYHYKNYRIHAQSEGPGEDVASWTMNGKQVCASLQIPTSLFLSGKNEILIQRCEKSTQARLRSTTAELIDVVEAQGKVTFSARCQTQSEFIFDHSDAIGLLSVVDGAGNPVETTQTKLTEADVLVIKTEAVGTIQIEITSK